ncbi:hypothetical protein HWD99_07965 [Microbacterium sp. C5A9]|uniref:hypothetical protein n=1 Tax=Microbacterium sp. C5A9 TaxID=2736663 RepID=UPI001F51C132|nr:hypothetical protein [Microbacterium sp. C5A9]MCI1018554.1 hypothetical protein [Microbacterium sp. C5A9]
MIRGWRREAVGWLLAAAIALIVAGTVASSARSLMLFDDGDSLVVALLSRSVLEGDPLDWAMSSVLFLPEVAVFLGLQAILPLDVDGLLAISAVINLLALYGAIRLVAGRARSGRTPVPWSLTAFAAFGALAMTASSPSRDSFELASLQLTTTYYSATVVAVVLTIGLVRRMLDAAPFSVALAVALGAVATLSTLSNPLYAAWATVPLGVILALLAWRSPLRSRTVGVAVILVGGSALGMLARIPLSAWIANTGAGYADPARWRESLLSYGGVMVERLQTPPGLVAALIVMALVVVAAIRTRNAGDAGERLVAASSWAVPLLVGVGAIALGTHAARYLQPVAFVPVLALVALSGPLHLRGPHLHRLRLHRLRPSSGLVHATAAVAAVLLLVGGSLSVPRLAAAAHRTDDDLACVTDWVDASGRTGAGQFWTVRLPKLHLTDPSRLVQVDHQLHGYAWLVNRTDFTADHVTFLVEDAQTVPWELPTTAEPQRTIDCGRYTILDFGGDASLPIGPAHS